MKLLIVDDDFHVIRGIQQNLRWEMLCVDQIFYALGAAAARPILLKNPIDIMICDIEMPKETGLDLVDWVRAQKLAARVIFLTSYARFEYAQRAITLGSFEYLLKPVDYRLLEKSVLAAARAVESSRQNEMGYFWNRIIAGEGLLDSSGFDGGASEGRLSYLREMMFLPVVFQSESPMGELWNTVKARAVAGAGMMATTSMRKTLAEYEYFGRLSEYSSVLLLKTPLNSNNDPLDACVRDFMENLAKTLADEGIALRVGVGLWSIVDLIYEDIQNICDMMYEAPRIKNHILYLGSYEPGNTAEAAPDLSLWAKLLKAEQIQPLKQQIRKYLEMLEGRNELSGRRLQQLGMDMTQLVYAYLDSVNIYAHMLFDNEESRRMYGRAALSAAHMMAYMDDLLDKSMSYKTRIEQAHDLPDIIKKYMDDHFRENITREELSRLVFLNPDYLSRLFKRKMGVSISSYLIQKRIDLAKELLAGTRTPVSVISSQVGYDNFAYFTKIFRDKVGMSPNEYRKSCQRNES